MRDASALPTMTVEEYFRFEETSPVKHEYVAGEVYAMSGATARHDRIATNVLVRLSLVARSGPCDVFSDSMRVQIARDRYYYPDVTVVCTPVAGSDIVVRNPCVVVEVTSPSTARIDRGEKLDAYRSIASLETYLIIDHRRRRIEHHSRDGHSGEWRRAEILGEGRVRVPCLDVDLTLDEIYERVELPSVSEPEPVDYEVDEFAINADESIDYRSEHRSR
jgi:Uma2 family endonuclease